MRGKIDRIEQMNIYIYIYIYSLQVKYSAASQAVKVIHPLVLSLSAMNTVIDSNIGRRQVHDGRATAAVPIHFTVGDNRFIRLVGKLPTYPSSYKELYLKNI